MAGDSGLHPGPLRRQLYELVTLKPAFSEEMAFNFFPLPLLKINCQTPSKILNPDPSEWWGQKGCGAGPGGQRPRGLRCPGVDGLPEAARGSESEVDGAQLCPPGSCRPVFRLLLLLASPNSTSWSLPAPGRRRGVTPVPLFIYFHFLRSCLWGFTLDTRDCIQVNFKCSLRLQTGLLMSAVIRGYHGVAAR